MYILPLDVTWDQNKARKNARKHGVTFGQALTALMADHILEREDPDAEGEQRFVALAPDETGTLLVVVYAYEGETVKIISARRAKRREQRDYARRVRL